VGLGDELREFFDGRVEPGCVRLRADSVTI